MKPPHELDERVVVAELVGPRAVGGHHYECPRRAWLLSHARVFGACVVYGQVAWSYLALFASPMPLNGTGVSHTRVEGTELSLAPGTPCFSIPTPVFTYQVHPRP
ncbi:hypothetical protein GOBAR_AA34696 [Gossypium barbadense]|uniref:Uncharacterized protein n=1 Tax=Gossypium barbadense TaxID=3634 RepID=A0A2P5W4K9_GOSBA|nr:hypothetical protein GOBAR_AA34696 [Gossypium barbadense]